MLITDFGLSRALGIETHFNPTVTGNGTPGWRAQEILRSRGEKQTSNPLGKAVDIFALGCIDYYVLTNGKHPFGVKQYRDMNIFQGKLPKLDDLKDQPYALEAIDIIGKMVLHDSDSRSVQLSSHTCPQFYDHS